MVDLTVGYLALCRELQLSRRLRRGDAWRTEYASGRMSETFQEGSDDAPGDQSWLPSHGMWWVPGLADWLAMLEPLTPGGITLTALGGRYSVDWTGAAAGYSGAFYDTREESLARLWMALGTQAKKGNNG